MEIFDNVIRIVMDDMAVEIKRGSKLSIASACFSIYAYLSLLVQFDVLYHMVRAGVKAKVLMLDLSEVI